MTIDRSMPDARYITLDGLKIQYFDWGNEKAPALFFLHGGGGNPVNWAQNANYFKNKYHCLALTHRGHSGSDFATPDRYTPKDLMIEIANFFDALNIKKVSIIGSSSAGMIAVYYAATHQERVEKLVFTEMPPVLNSKWVEFSKQYLSKLKSEFNSYKEVFDYLRETHDPTASDEKYKPYVDAATKVLPNGKIVFKNDSNFERVEFQAAIEAAKAIALGKRPEPDNWYLITQVKCPTLIIRAAKSDMLDKEVMQKMIAFMPNAQGAEIDSGHVVYVDKPDEFNSLVEKFLEGK